jgi:hypothetical protein
MKHINKVFLLVALAFAASSSFAAKPTSIKFIEDLTSADGQAYSFYSVKCSNGQQKKISAWDNRKRWCLGKGQQDTCKKKQIKIAKKACK